MSGGGAPIVRAPKSSSRPVVPRSPIPVAGQRRRSSRDGAEPRPGRAVVAPGLDRRALARRSSVSPAASSRLSVAVDEGAVVDALEEDLVGPRELVRAQHVAVVGDAAGAAAARRTGGCDCSSPGSVATRVQTSASGPYCVRCARRCRSSSSSRRAGSSNGRDLSPPRRSPRSTSVPRPRAGSRSARLKLSTREAARRARRARWASRRLARERALAVAFTADTL